MDNPFIQFESKVSQILNTVFSKDDKQDEIKANLFAGLMMELTNRLTLNPATQKNIIETASELENASPATEEDFMSLYTSISEKTKIVDIDIDEEIRLASKTVLHTFIENLTPQLPADKALQINAFV